MRRALLLGLALAVGPALAPGCGLTEPGQRLTDASQILHVGLGGSLEPGLYAWALVPVFGTSLGYQGHASYVGSDYGYTWGWHQAAYGVLVGGEIVRAEFGQSVDGFFQRPLHQAYVTQSHTLVINGTVTDRRLPVGARSIALRRVEAGVHVLVVSVSLGIDLFALGDFVAGWFGFDPSDDDGVALPHAPFPLEPPPADRRKAGPQHSADGHAPADGTEPADGRADGDSAHADADEADDPS